MISAVIIAKNEQDKITSCLKSVMWCDEIVLVDDYSADSTARIAKSHGARIFKRSLNNNFANQRNFGLKKARGEWVLFVDADEIVTKALSEEIIKSISSNEYSGYFIRRKGSTDEFLVRLAKKDAGMWERVVHETWKIDGKVGKLYSPLLHSPAPSLSKFIDKINFYSSLHAEANTSEGKKPSIIKIVFWPILRFMYNFFIKREYKAGTRGFINAGLMSFHSFLAWSKQWELQEKK